MTREPGKKDPNCHIDKGELAWKYIGLGMIARTFPNSDRLVLTTGRGPKADEIDYRVVRDVVTAHVLHECRPEDTPDAEVNRKLAFPTSIRVELTLKSAKKMLLEKNADAAEVFSRRRASKVRGYAHQAGVVSGPNDPRPSHG